MMSLKDQEMYLFPRCYVALYAFQGRMGTKCHPTVKAAKRAHINVCIMGKKERNLLSTNLNRSYIFSIPDSGLRPLNRIFLHVKWK